MKPDDLLPSQTIELEEEWDPLLEATLELEQCSRHLDLEDWILHRLRHMEREITVNLPLVREHGEVTSVTGLRVQHYSGGAPTMGTVRFSPEAHYGSLRPAAMAMTWQLALLGLPFGGAAGAVVCNPDELSERELQTLARDYVHGLRGVAGPFRDVLMPDAVCNEQTMAWIFDAHARTAGQMELAAVTGKPAALWGIPGYYNATAAGIMALLRHIVAQESTSLTGQRVAVQGFGALGASIARALYDAGTRVIALADASGGLYNADGINLPEIETHVAHKGMLFGFPEAESVCNADVLEADCEMLVLAAHERQIGATNAERIQAPLVIEATNGAIIHTAEDTLQRRGIRVIPDLLANAGAVLAAFAEWKQNTELSCGMTAGLDQFLGSQITSAYDLLENGGDHHNFGLRRAAQLVALERVSKGMRLR